MDIFLTMLILRLIFYWPWKKVLMTLNFFQTEKKNPRQSAVGDLFIC